MRRIFQNFQWPGSRTKELDPQKTDSATRPPKSKSRCTKGKLQDDEPHDRSASPSLDSRDERIKAPPGIEPYPGPGVRDFPVDQVAKYAIRGAKIASSFSPIPGLDLVIGAVENIVTICRNVPKNKAAAALLGEHCEGFVNGVQAHISKERSPNMKILVSDAESLMNEILYRVQEWCTLKFLEGFIMQDRIANDIQAYHEKIENLKEKYKLTIYTEIIDWQRTHENRCKEDHDELLGALADNDINNEIRHNYQLQHMDKMKKELLEEFAAVVQKSLLEVSSTDSGGNRTLALENTIKTVYTVSDVPPPGIEITEGLITYESIGRPVDYSQYCDIYRHKCFGKDCRIQIVRRAEIGPKTRIRFNRQLRAWKSILEKSKQGEKLYVLPLVYAICRENGPEPMLGFVTEWMANGNVLDYLKKYGDEVDRRDLIKKIALGIKTLHSLDPPIAHGYIRASNIYIDNTFDPLLADFGLTRVVESEDAVPLTTMSIPDSRESFRWLAPEVSGIFPEGSVKPTNGHTVSMTTKSDIYGFGLTVLEIMTEEKPFSDKRNQAQILFHLISGGTPSKPTGEVWEKVKRRGMDDELWSLLMRCWSININDRPTIEQVLKEL